MLEASGEKKRNAIQGNHSSMNKKVHSADHWKGTQRRPLDTVAHQALFRGIPPRTLERLVERCDLRHLDQGVRLLTPGQYNDYLYLLLDGQLKAHLDHLDTQGGISIEPGECAGEISIIDSKPVTAFVVATKPSTVLAVPAAQFWDEFIPNPQIAKNFMRLISDRFRARHQLIQHALEERLRYENLQKELRIAQQIQAGMLRRDLDLAPMIDLVVKMAPARHVGGDFYDVFPVGANEYCVAIGDVAGKGVPAALFMVRVITLLRTEMLKQQPLHRAVQQLNHALCDEHTLCTFVTLVVGIFNQRTGEFRYVLAGHPPLIYGEARTGFRLLDRPAGIVAGIDPNATYEVASLTLAEGDLLLLYTDGITEAMNDRRELFSEERLLDCLGTMPCRTVSVLADKIDRAVQGFVGNAPPSDDQALVILRYKGTLRNASA